jgi:hypothetical protein
LKVSNLQRHNSQNTYNVQGYTDLQHKLYFSKGKKMLQRARLDELTMTFSTLVQI